MTEKQKILIVDDKKENLVALRQVLGDLDADVVEATSGNEALAATLEHDFAVAILDVMLPGMDGFELAEHLRGNEGTRHIPIVFVTASFADERHMFKGYEAGGIDYITKPYLPEVMVSKVNMLLEMDRDRRELQRHRDELEALVAERTQVIKCLYAVSSLVAEPRETVEETLEAAVELIPPGWQYPEITCARVVFQNREFVTANFQETPWRQSASIELSGQAVGRVDVFYLEEKPEAHEGPFLGEERELIIDIARQLGVMIQRKRAEEAQADQARRLDYILQGTHVGTWEWNVQTGATVFNERWADIIGYTSEEISPVSIDTWMKSCHPDDLKESDRLLQACFSGESEYYHCECRMRHKSGEWVWVLDRGKVATWTEDGKPEWMYGTHQDITERKQAEDHIRLHSEIISEGVYLIGLDDGLIKYTNSQFEKMFGYEEGEMIGKEVSIINAPTEKEPEETKNEMMGILNKTGEWHGEIKNIKKDGTHFWCHANVSLHDHPLFGRVLISAHTDITEKKQAEEQLHHFQKMQSVGRLAGGVAHDFNNMLGVILGHTDMILEGMDPDEPFHANLTEIKKAGERSANLTRQLLAFASKQTVAPKVLDLNQSVEGMLKMLHRLIGEDIDMAWIPGEAVWPVKIDPAQIDQILANLCVNARDAIADVGKVTIETGNKVFDEDYCKQHAGFVPGEYTLLAVSDNGCGMDAETLGNAFEPFFTTKESNQGTGLGLATVYGAVKQNNGFINVYSEPGQGTTFRIYLPRHAAAQAAETKEPKTQAAERGSETILLVEDEPALLKLTTTLLEETGHKVIAVATPGEAIARAREYSGEIHLLMTDVVMPEMNGRDLANNILSLYPGLKRVFMSGYTANVIAHHGVLDEDVHFIQKPFSIGDLTAKVREALED